MRHSRITKVRLPSLKSRLVSHRTFGLTPKLSLAFIIAFTTVVVIDSSIVKFSSYSGVETSTQINAAIFFVFCAFFIVMSSFFLYSVKGSSTGILYTEVASKSLRYLEAVILVTVISTIAIMLIIILQMLMLNNYNVVLLRVQTYISHLSPIVFLAFLIFLFGRWIVSKKNLIILLYGISFCLVCVNLLISLMYLESYFSTAALPLVKPYPIYRYVTILGGLPLTESLSTIFDGLSLTSFLLTWLATALLMNQYRYRMGRVKYYSLVSIPLVYYVFPFQNYIGDVFLPLLLSSPVTFSIVYVLIFSATKQVGALLFSLAFWARLFASV